MHHSYTMISKMITTLDPAMIASTWVIFKISTMQSYENTSARVHTETQTATAWKRHWSSYKNQHICECFTLQYKYERHKSPQACNFPSENNSCRQLIQLWSASPLIRWISFGHDIIRTARTLQKHIGAQRKLQTILDALCVADLINLSFLNLSQAFIVVRLWTWNTGNGN